MDEETPLISTKPASVRLNLKCPRERELLEKYYNERRVLDTSVPKEVITAFNLKTEKQAKTREKSKERLKNIIETDPERLERIREQGRISKQKMRAKEKAERLRSNEDNQSQISGSTNVSSNVSSKLFPSSSERSFPTHTSSCRSESCRSECTDSTYRDDDDTLPPSEPPTPVMKRKPVFFGSMRF